MSIINIASAMSNSVLMGIVNLVDAGGAAAKLRVYSGDIPANPETTPAGSLLAELTMSYPCIAGKIVTNAMWATNEITYQVAAHGLTVGARIKASGFTPSGYDGEYTVTAVVDVDNFKVAETVDPGAFSAAGTLVAIDGGSLVFDTIADDTSADATGTATFARVVDSNGTAALDVDVGLGLNSETLVFNNVNVEATKLVTVSSFSITN